MTEITELHRALVARVCGGQATAPPGLRQAAFDNHGLSDPIRTLIQRVAERSYLVTDDDIAAVRADGLSEDQIFEIVVCAAVGQASREYDGALAVLAEVTGA